MVSGCKIFITPNKKENPKIYRDFPCVKIELRDYWAGVAAGAAAGGASRA